MSKTHFTRAALALMATLVCLGGSASAAQLSEPDQARSARAGCVAKTAEYVAEAVIEDPVRTLVAKSREFYPNVMDLISEEIPSDSYVEALAGIGSQYGCDSLLDHIRKIDDEVDCYAEQGLDTDENGTRDVARSSLHAREVFEAYFACQTADRKCKSKSGGR